ncbi:Gamma-aminobutyric acid type B receptor subunit 1 [Eumeta japonica]|uniref:Gamma-aminobutyric acid type B receptor subunit 1 n=1 Tax=Eumeta variegata TaxID=151549 RepID=A0A4C1Z950_EUMVA|nr:Gamma-aminobutyric acid type B receptor subunit 1 [Eumeta japonica]
MYGAEYAWLVAAAPGGLAAGVTGAPCDAHALAAALEGLVLVDAHRGIVGDEPSFAGLVRHRRTLLSSSALTVPTRLGMPAQTNKMFAAEMAAAGAPVSRFAAQAYDAVWAIALALRGPEAGWRARAGADRTRSTYDLGHFDYNRSDMAKEFLNQLANLNFLGVSLRASQIYKSRLSLQRGGYGPRTGTPMSGAERARRFRERRKAAAADLASTSTTGIPVLMDVTNEQTIDISIGSVTELRDVNISRSEAMQNHWRSADKRFKTVFEANPFVLRKHNVGDICLVDVKVEDHTLFILGAVYIHPKASAEAVKLCLYQSLLPYSANLTKLIPNSQPDLETPMVLCGDFNCDPQQNSYLVEFMRNEFGLNYVQTLPTTLGNTTIDYGRARVVALYTAGAALACAGCARARWAGGVPAARRLLVLRVDSVWAPARLAVAVLAAAGIALATTFLAFNLHYSKRRSIKLSSPRLNNMTAIGCVLVYAAVALLGVDHSLLPPRVPFSAICIVSNHPHYTCRVPITEYRAMPYSYLQHSIRI